MSHENKAVVRRLFQEVWNEGKLEVLDEILSPEYLGKAPPETMAGPEGYKDLVRKFRTALPDINFSIEEMLAEGERVATIWVSTWTHEGEINGIAPTGKQGTTAGVTMCRCEDGKIMEEFGAWDALGFLQQIGAVPE